MCRDTEKKKRYVEGVGKEQNRKKKKILGRNKLEKLIN